MNYKELFIDKDDVLLIRKELVRVLGDLNEAVILNQLHYWIEINKKADRNLYDGKYWIFNTYQTWKETDFDFWSVDTIRRTLTRLENKGIVLTANYNKLKIDKTKWYTIDYEKLQEFIDEYDKKQSAIMDNAYCEHDMANCIDGNGNISIAVPENNTKNTTDINSKDNSFFKKKVRERARVINQDDFAEQIHNIADYLGEELLHRDQANNFERFGVYFIERYAETFGRKHPFLQREALIRISAAVTDYVDIDHKKQGFTTCFFPLVSEMPDDNSYESVVDLYFETEFRDNIDYSMAHFCQKNVLTKLMWRDATNAWFTNERLS